MDFLGLTTLTIIDDALKLIEKYKGVKLALDELPLDDAKTYEMSFTRVTPAACSSLNRRACAIFCAATGRIVSGTGRAQRAVSARSMGMIDDFVERKHGRRDVVYDLPEMKEILEETYGVMVYQEQVTRIANRLAGYTLGEADLLRRAMGKKKPEEMALQRVKFVEGAKANGHPPRKIEKIFDLMEKFAGYGFPKAHSAAYAYLAFHYRLSQKRAIPRNSCRRC